MLNTRGANGVALHDSVLRGVQIFYSDSGGKPAYQRNDLLPISPVVAEVWLAQKARDVGKEPVTGLVSLALAVLAAQNFLIGVGWTLKPIVPEAFYPLSVAQEQALGNILSAVIDTLSIPVVPFNIKDERKFLKQRRISYGGEVVSVRRDIIADKVFAAWPKEGEAAVCNILQFLDQHLVDDLSEPKSCLIPQADWPEVTPVSKVHASDTEWYNLCKGAAKRGMFCSVPEEEVFCNQFGTKVLNGAMCVDKFKTVDGESVHVLRFISNLTPINSYMRKLRGDEKNLPASCFSVTYHLAGWGVYNMR